MYCPKIRTNVLDVLKLNPKNAAIWFKTHHHISASNCEFVCVDPTTPTEKADKLLTFLVKSPGGLKALISYLHEEQYAELAAEIENRINIEPFSSHSMTTKLPTLTTRYDSTTYKFISDLKQFTRHSCEVIRQHWKDGLAVGDLEHAYGLLTLANEEELSSKYKWVHDDLQSLAFLYVDEVRIFITGGPHFGKSTLLNKIAYDWAADKNLGLTKHFDFIYYLPLSEATGDSLSEAILTYLAFDDKETSSAVISKCFTDESYRSRTLFLLDAYDEANLMSFPALSRIAEGRENPLDKCVITSRPLQVDGFPKPIHISARDFNASAQSNYIPKHVHDKKQRVQLSRIQWKLLRRMFFLIVVCILANSLIYYLYEANYAQLTAETENAVNNEPFSNESTKLTTLSARYDSDTRTFISELKQFTRHSCEVIRQHWKDNLAVDDLEHAYVPLTIANEKEQSLKYKWNHDDLQNLAFLYVNEVRIFITGEPGFGKSTLLNKIAYDWAADKNLALTKHSDFVYYLPLSEATGNNLSEAILTHLAFDNKGTSSAVISRCFTEESYRSRTLFLLDAYDEVNRKSFPPIERIAEGRENPLTKCVITSRPLQVEKIPKPIHISARGFDASARADYITKHVHDPGLRAHLLGQKFELFNSPFFLTVVCVLANHHKPSTSKDSQPISSY